MSEGPLVDSFGRVHRDLRISVTDRCNFRCSYCMPEEGVSWLPRADLLTYEEIARVAGVAVRQLGIESIRLTGGEPTIRAHLPVLIEQLAALDVDLSLTTNGTLLDHCAHDLADAGLRRINISLDSLRPDRFQAITRRDELDRVLAGIDAALGAGLSPVKINCVAMRGVNDDELVDFATFGRERGVLVRFIEFMPLDAQGAWTNDKVVTQAEVVDVIGATYPLIPVTDDGSSPSARFAYKDGLGELGVIASVTKPFCQACDRIRLTAEGQVRNCLFALDEVDLRGPLRSGASDAELGSIIRGNVVTKWAGHQINQEHFIRPRRSMSQIGG